MAKIHRNESFGVQGEHYDEDGNRITQEEWAILFQAKRWQMITEGEGVHISTVFIGLNHQFDHTKPPLIFESLVHVDDDERDMWRYTSKAKAIEGHGILWNMHRKKREWIISDRITPID